MVGAETPQNAQYSDHAPAKPHGFVTRGIHWVSILLIGYGYAKGLDNIGQLADPAVLRFEVIFAAILGLVFIIRLFWTRKIAGSTRLPQAAPKWEHAVSKVVHYGLYGAVFAIVGSGLGIAIGYSLAGPRSFMTDIMVGLHEAALVALPVLIAIHVAGAIWHKFVRQDGVLESMTGKLPV